MRSNKHLQLSGKEGAEQDIAACQDKADRTGLKSGVNRTGNIVGGGVLGLIIGAAGGYSFASFRLAWSVQYVIWAVAAVAILITRRKARRTIGDIEESKYLLEFFDEHQLVR